MKRTKIHPVVALTVLLATLVGTNAHAAYDAFLKIEGIEGESRVAGHEGEIEILSFSWGVSNPNAKALHGGGGAGKVTLTEFTVTKRSDKASPQLYRAAVVGEEFDGMGGDPPIRLIMRYTPDGDHPIEVFSIELDGSQIAELSGRIEPATRGSGDDQPMESLSLSFGKITMNASGQDDHGHYTGLRLADAISVDNPALED